MSETSLADVLKETRGKRSLREMGLLCGIDFSLLARIEKGQVATPGRETLAAISLGYQVPLETLAQLVYLGKPATDRGVTVSPDQSGGASGESELWSDTTKPRKKKSLAPT